MEITLEWDRTELEQYLLYDNWRPSKAMILLSGHTYANECILVDYRSHQTHEPNVNSLNARDSFMACEIEARRFKDDLLLKTEEAFQFLQSAWDSGYFPYSRYPPEFFIDWAIDKRRPPAWLDWAIDKGLYTPKELRNLPATIQNTPAAPEFDKASPTYPPELALALDAWRAVSTTEGKGKPKARIKAWLDTNAPKNLSNEAKERIAIVANWEKTGGATSTP